MRNLVPALVLAVSSTATALADDAPPSVPVVFLLDTSVSEQADSLSRRVAKLKEVLEKDASIQRFNVLTFDVTTRWIEPNGLLTNDAAGQAKALQSLDGLVAEGACDLGRALDRLAGVDLPKASPLRVFVLCGGKVSWGESDVPALLARFRQQCPLQVQFQCLNDPVGAKSELCTLLEADPKTLNVKPRSRREHFDEFLSRVDLQVKLLAGASGEQVKLLLMKLAEEEFQLPQAPSGTKFWRQQDLPEAYVRTLKENPRNTENYVREAQRRSAAGDAEGMVRALSSVVALHPDADACRLVGYRLLDAEQPFHAVRLFEQVQRQRPLEPHSYRDLARGLEDAGKFGLAAVQYEVLLAGSWNAKYTQSLKDVVQEEYGHMMRDAIRNKKVSSKLIDVFGERLEGFDSNKLQADLRVAISWNTDNTDVDLWVIEPDGTKCFYAMQRTPLGGELTQDVTQGYGPERYQMVRAKPGEYVVKVHFFSGPRNAQVVEGSHVNVVVRRFVGTPQEESQRFTVILKNKDDLVEVCRLKF